MFGYAQAFGSANRGYTRVFGVPTAFSLEPPGVIVRIFGALPYPNPFVSPSLDWLAWLGLASLASAWLVSSAAATTTGTTPEQAYITIGAALRAAAMVVDACSGVVAVVVAAADETSHAEARLAMPSQASQSREGLTNGIGYFVICDL